MNDDLASMFRWGIANAGVGGLCFGLMFMRVADGSLISAAFLGVVALFNGLCAFSQYRMAQNNPLWK